MDLIKFIGTPPTNLEQAVPIQKWDSVLWTERYADPGEFEIKAPLSTGLRELLPLGTIISHTRTLEAMVVENHEISETYREDPILTVTGRSLETILENRIVGMTIARYSNQIMPYQLLNDRTWNQAVVLINEHLVDQVPAADQIPYLKAVTNLAGTASGTSEPRDIKPGPVFNALQDLLAVDDCGVRVFRKNPFGVSGNNNETQFMIHRGSNRTSSVIFSWKSGELKSADYLFSQKKLKNSAVVLSRYLYRMVDTGPTNYDRRIMLVDGSDLDGNLSAPPTGALLTSINSKMDTRGRQALKRQGTVTISRADVSELTNHVYRRDYQIGDLVTLDGNFGQMATMRVIEHVEIEDENGASAHPTLAIPGI